VAVKVCAPTASDEVTNVAWPLLIVPVPSTVAPSEKVTEPAGPPRALTGEVTVAVSVTGCPAVTDAGPAVRVTELPAAATCWLIAVEMLPPLWSPPIESAWIECVPAVSVLVVSVAWPEPSTVPVPTIVGPSRKSTWVPAAKAPVETVAVSVIESPTVALRLLEPSVVVLG
jgi:hypothetical protein